MRSPRSSAGRFGYRSGTVGIWTALQASASPQALAASNVPGITTAPLASKDRRIGDGSVSAEATAAGEAAAGTDVGRVAAGAFGRDHFAAIHLANRSSESTVPLNGRAISNAKPVVINMMVPTAAATDTANKSNEYPKYHSPTNISPASGSCHDSRRTQRTPHHCRWNAQSRNTESPHDPATNTALPI